MHKVLIVPDTHAPYHDQRAWDLMITAASEWGPNIVVHMGDLADFYKISDYDTDPTREFSFDQEVEAARALRRELEDLNAGRYEFIEGNHEDRLRRYLQKKAPELFSHLTTDTLLELSQNGWGFTPYQESLKLGPVNFTHDTGGSGKYTTARALEEFQDSVVIGHHHSMSWLVNGDAKGNHHVAAQFGWLGDENNVDYMKRVKVRRKWSLGFGLGYITDNAEIMYLVPCPIVNYRCMVEGVEYFG